jgi:cytidine deaminase
MERDLASEARPERHGTVFVAYSEPNDQPPGWYAYWDAVEADSGASAGFLADGGRFATPEEAATWGRARSPRVVIQDARGRHFWAGDAPMPDDPDLTGRWEPGTPWPGSNE